MWDVELDVNDAPRDGYEDSSSDGTDFSYGLGVMFDASRHVSLRLDYTAVTTDKSSANISVGVQYNF
jgi:outer membrane autotransporter protein